MVEFIVENYYVILVVCIILIFAIIGYIIDTLKRRKYEEENLAKDSYIAEEEIFIKNFDNNEVGLQDQVDNSVEEMLKEYNEETKEENS